MTIPESLAAIGQDLGFAWCFAALITALGRVLCSLIEKRR